MFKMALRIELNTERAEAAAIAFTDEWRVLTDAAREQESISPERIWCAKGAWRV